MTLDNASSHVVSSVDATLKDLRKVVPHIRHAIMWSNEVLSELDAHIVKNCWRMACILPATWNVDFAVVDERENNRLQEESDELGALISKLRMGDDEMSIETYIQMEGEDIIEL
jgi:cell division protein FtsB